MATSIPHHGSSTQGTSGQGQGALVDRLAQTAEQTAAKAIDRVKDTRERAEAGIEQQHQKITTRIRGLSDALRSSGESLGDNEQVSALLNIASEQVDRLASYVDNATPRGVARDIERFARERPAWFFGGAFLAGLALGRFAKSSREMHEDDGLQLSEGSRGYAGGEYPQARGGAGATYTSGIASGQSGGSQGASYSGYTSGGSATSGGPYTGGGTTQRMGSSYPSGSGTGATSSGYSTGTPGSTYTGSGSSSGYTGSGSSTGTGTGSTPSTNAGGTLSGTGSSGYGGSSAGASYSGSSASGSAASPSSSATPSTTPATTQTPSSAPRANNNNGSTGSKS